MNKMYIKNSPPVPHLLQAQQAPALPYCKVVGRPALEATQHHRSTQPPTTSVCLGTPERSVCVIVQLANRRKIRVEVQGNPDGDPPSVYMAAHADLRICGYNKPYIIVKTFTLS